MSPVVEVYFLNAQTQEYLQVILGPWGHYFVGLFKGYRKQHRVGLPLDFIVTERIILDGPSWVS